MLGIIADGSTDQPQNKSDEAAQRLGPTRARTARLELLVALLFDAVVHTATVPVTYHVRLARAADDRKALGVDGRDVFRRIAGLRPDTTPRDRCGELEQLQRDNAARLRALESDLAAVRAGLSAEGRNWTRWADEMDRLLAPWRGSPAVPAPGTGLPPSYAVSDREG